MSDRYSRIMGEVDDGQGLVKVVNLTAAAPTYQMRPEDTCVRAYSATGADATGIVTLPSLAESAGRHYFIHAPEGATGNDISLYEKETGVELTTNGDMDADDDHLLLYSTGVSWLTRLDGVA